MLSLCRYYKTKALNSSFAYNIYQKMRAITRHLLTGMIGAAMLVPSVYMEAKYGDGFDRHQETETIQGEVNVPLYNPIKLGAYHCSRYARLAAKEMFGKDFSHSDAWNRPYNDRVVGKTSNREITSQIANGILTPGMMIGIYVPQSAHQNMIDAKGKKSEYGHVALYIGVSPEGDPLLAEQFGISTRVVTLEDMMGRGLEVREIIDTRRD